jgi:hypothetical protein
MKKNCEQIFGCLVISEDGKLSPSTHPARMPARIKLAEIFPILQSSLQTTS